MDWASVYNNCSYDEYVQIILCSIYMRCYGKNVQYSERENMVDLVLDSFIICLLIHKKHIIDNTLIFSGHNFPCGDLSFSCVLLVRLHFIRQLKNNEWLSL